MIFLIEAIDIPDICFQEAYNFLDHGRRFVIGKGVYACQTRWEYDYILDHIKHPGPSFCRIFPQPAAFPTLWSMITFTAALVTAIHILNTS